MIRRRVTIMRSDMILIFTLQCNALVCVRACVRVCCVVLCCVVFVYMRFFVPCHAMVIESFVLFYFYKKKKNNIKQETSNVKQQTARIDVLFFNRFSVRTTRAGDGTEPDAGTELNGTESNGTDPIWFMVKVNKSGVDVISKKKVTVHYTTLHCSISSVQSSSVMLVTVNNNNNPTCSIHPPTYLSFLFL